MPFTLPFTTSATSAYISWWYTPTTKLGFYFNNFGLTNAQDRLTASVNGGLDGTNGMGASIQENYRYENIITNHPVENTPSISDHIIPLPTIFSIQGIITSIIPYNSVLSKASSLILNQTVPGISNVSFTQLNSAIDILVEMANGPKSNQGITLQTGLLFKGKYARFNNLAVQSLDLPRNNEYGKSSIKFTIVFKQLLLTTVVETTVSQQRTNGLTTEVDIEVL